jgi:hypothetical protein
MALIEFRIDLDGNNNVTIVSTVQRIDPGDEIVMITSTANAALQFNADSPFAAPAAEKILLLPQGESRMPLQVARSIDLSQEVALCGTADSEGNFNAWTQGAGFPGNGPIHNQSAGGGHS